MLVNNISHDLVTERAKRDWFAYWKHYKQGDCEYCAEANCLNKATYGALVTIQPKDYDHVYVIGLCECHGKNVNQIEQPLIELSPDAELIESNLTL
ncbi:hypothetical protein VA7868_02830 [Vibrio aerogenes CECT 7868]|uniref:Uncharacterized protein n=1 Tax=Vibrio aerogenes CECT 7868 TaxID=1216006 RepID=A0A1M5ZK15_9VIBR|nr:hypothetical protein [Vibrio aerogenes]SHI24504.1 hypothetical protein VA7868_02830 [Vibrio aerogenes CECT 7868]